MKTKSPAFQFYPADYLSDSNTIVFTAEQAGHYLRLLCLCWLEGSIPIDPRPLLKGGATISDECLNPILKCFRLNRKKTALVHPRLDAERCKQIAWREKSSAGGKASALKKRTLSGNNGASRVVEPKANTMFVSSSSSSSSSSNKKHIKEVEEIIAYLNTKANRNYRFTDKNISLITARLKEGYSKVDCFRVIDTKAAQWLGDPEMDKNLRIKTLFAVGHFDDYLNEKTEIEKQDKPKKKTTVRHNLDLIKNIDLGGEDDNKRIQDGDGDIVRVGTTT